MYAPREELNVRPESTTVKIFIRPHMSAIVSRVGCRMPLYDRKRGSRRVLPFLFVAARLAAYVGKDECGRMERVLPQKCWIMSVFATFCRHAPRTAAKKVGKWIIC